MSESEGEEIVQIDEEAEMKKVQDKTWEAFMTFDREGNGSISTTDM